MDDQTAVPQQPVPPVPQQQPAAPPSGVPKMPGASKNAMQAAINSTARVAPFKAQAAGISSDIGALSQQIQSTQKSTDEELKALGKDTPLPQFHPIPPKDASKFFGMMMVLGALSGRSTMAPMTAAMNNMTAIMKAQKEHNTEMLAAQTAEFDRNYKTALDKHKEYVEEKKSILEKYKYDMAAAKDEMFILKAKYGVAEGVHKAGETGYKDDLQASINAERTRIALFGGAKAGWKPTGKLDEQGHEIYYNGITREEKPGNMVGWSEKETAATGKSVADLQKAKAAAMAKAPEKQRAAIAKIYDDQIRAAGGEEPAVDWDALK